MLAGILFLAHVCLNPQPSPLDRWENNTFVSFRIFHCEAEVESIREMNESYNLKTNIAHPALKTKSQISNIKHQKIKSKSKNILLLAPTLLAHSNLPLPHLHHGSSRMQLQRRQTTFSPNEKFRDLTFMNTGSCGSNSGNTCCSIYLTCQRGKCLIDPRLDQPPPKKNSPKKL